jgi:hypothetical protein
MGLLEVLIGQARAVNGLFVQFVQWSNRTT